MINEYATLTMAVISGWERERNIYLLYKKMDKKANILQIDGRMRFLTKSE